MRIWLRGVGIALCSALLTVSIIAQDENTITVTGSKPVVELFRELSSASGVETNLDVNITGTSSGFASFCAGEADVVGATRPLSVDEEAACTQNDVVYNEYLIGYDAVAVIAHPDLLLDCLTTSDLTTSFAPSAQDQVMNWEQTGLDEVEGNMTIVLPPDNTSTYVLFDNIVEGVGLRRDATLELDSASIISVVSNTPGAIGIIPFAALDATANVNLIQLDTGDPAGCFAPSLETIENRQYSVLDRLYLYVNSAGLAEPELQDILEFVTDSASTPVIAEAGFTAPSVDIYRQNRTILDNNETGRTFSLDVTAFKIPDAVSGAVNIGGASNLIGYVQSATSQFTTLYPGVTLNVNIEGEPSGFRQLCNGEIDVMFASSDLPEEHLQNCQANNIEIFPIELGKQSIVLLSSASSSFLDCLTVDQIVTIWGSPSSGTILNWNQINESFPESPLILVAPPTGSISADILLTPPTGSVVPIRLDTAESNSAPQYRATAVGNVTGGLTFMTWHEYQSIQEADAVNIQLIAVDGGNGCVMPSLETIEDGSYPYAVSNSLIVNRRSLSRSDTQSFLWYLFEDQNFSLIENAELTGIEFGDLPSIRSALQTAFTDAIAAAIPELPSDTQTVQPSTDLEATPEATIETTPEATGQ